MIAVGRNIIAHALLPLIEHERIFVLCDRSLLHAHQSLLQPLADVVKAEDWLIIEGGESNKSLEVCQQIWSFLIARQANRLSVLIIVGGGSISDLGSFAASTFHRGIDTIVLSTTLLSMVDASVGGKTAIDFRGIKNLIGTFHPARAVIADTCFLDTLPKRQLISGFAELIKHALLMGADDWLEILLFDPLFPQAKWPQLVEKHIRFKESIVEADPYDKGIRAQLNLGHSIGHALEAFSMLRLPSLKQTPLLHGEAVAVGLVAELYLSHRLCGFPSKELHRLAMLVKSYFRPYSITCADYDEIYSLALADKKNKSSEVHLVTLPSVGANPDLLAISRELFDEALDFYREVFGV